MIIRLFKYAINEKKKKKDLSSHRSDLQARGISAEIAILGLRSFGFLFQNVSIFPFWETAPFWTSTQTIETILHNRGYCMILHVHKGRTIEPFSD